MRPHKLLCLAGALLLCAGTLPLAAAEGSGGFSLKLEPLVIGALDTDVDTDSAKFMEYRDLGSGFMVPKLSLSGESEDGNRYLTLNFNKPGKRDGRYTLEYGLAGKYALSFDYNKIIHNFGNNAKLLWTQTSPGRYEIADPTQAALQGAIVSQFARDRAGLTFGFLNNLISPYLATAREVNLGLQRDRATTRLDVLKDRPVSWSFEYYHENRNGTRPFGGSFGFNNVTELPEPIDYDTTDASISGRWAVKGGALNFGYRLSKFENNVSTLIYDNPFRSTDATDASAYTAPGAGSIGGASKGLADLAADNKMTSLFANGRWKFAGNWFAGGAVTYSDMKQDDPLLPYTLNTAIRGIGFDGRTFDPTNVANLPVKSADREAKVLNLNGDLGTRFGKNFSFTLRYRYYDYDNKSKRIEFPGYVRFNAVWENIARVTVPYAYTTQDVSAEFGWNLGPTADLALSYARKSWDRKFREIKSSDEDVLKGSFDWRPNGRVTVRASGELGDRSIGHYDTDAAEASFVEPEGASNLPALRKYDEAARKYNSENVWAQFLLGDAVTLSVGVTHRLDDYNKSQFGLKKDKVMQYNLDFSYNPNEKTSLYLFGNISDRDVNQAARQSGATVSTRDIDSWTVKFNEKNDTYGLGFTAKPNTSWAFDVSGSYAKADGNADFTAFVGGLPLASPGAGLPARTAAQDIGNYEDFELFSAKLKVDYTINANLTVGAWYQYEDYTADSFINEGLTNYLPGALLLVGSNGDYTANLVALTLKVDL